MSVAFKELDGSPLESWGSGGMRATRMLLVAWAERLQFVAELAGQGAIGGDPPGTYPGMPNVVITNVKCRPFTSDIIAQVMTSTSDDLQRYLSFAFFEIEYQYAAYSWPAAETIELQEHTWLTYRASGGAEAFVHKTADWSFDESGSPDAADDQAFFTQRIPLVDHHFTWHNVRQVPYAAIKSVIGMVNNSLWLGVFEPETMLFDGYDLTQEFIVLDDGTTPAPSQSLTYLFKERRVHVPQAGVPQFPFTVEGWNFIYRTDKGSRGWARVYDENGDSPYRLTDNFPNLFLYAVS